MVKPLELDAVGRKWTPAVGWHAGHNALKGYIQPDRYAVAVDCGAVLRIHESATARRDHDVAQRDLFEQDRALQRPEIRLPPLREDVGDRRTLTLFNERVDVGRLPSQPSRKRARHGRFPGSHEADEINLVGF